MDIDQPVGNLEEPHSPAILVHQQEPLAVGTTHKRVPRRARTAASPRQQLSILRTPSDPGRRTPQHMPSQEASGNVALYSSDGEKFHVGTSILVSRNFANKVVAKGVLLEGRAQYIILDLN